MKKLKIVFAVLLAITAIFVITATYCYLKVTVYAPKPYFKDGIWHDPPLSTYKALHPYRMFLDYTPIGIILLSALWVLWGTLWFRDRAKAHPLLYRNNF